MKKFISFTCILLSLTIMFSFNSVAIQTATSESIYLTISKNFINDYERSSVDVESISICSIIPLYNLSTDALYAYAVDVQDKYHNRAYVIVNATTNVVMEYAEAISVYAQNSATYSNTSIYYYAPYNYLCKNANSYIDLSTGSTINLTTAVTESSSTTERQVYRYINGIKTQETERIRTTTTRSSSMNYILNVPDYQQTSTHLCMNTSMLNIIAYWDANGLPNLITGTIAQARADIEDAFAEAGGIGYNNHIADAVANYVTDHGDYYSDVWLIWNPTFDDYEFEIDYGDPCFAGFPQYYGGPHMTTGVGYQIIDDVEYVIVHDNHYTTPYDVVILFSEVDFVGSVSILDLNNLN